MQTLKYEYYLKVWGATISQLTDLGLIQLPDSGEVFFSSKKERDSFKEVVLSLQKYAKATYPSSLQGLVFHEEQGPQVRFRPILNAIILHKGEYRHITEEWSFVLEENFDHSKWEYVLDYKFHALNELEEDYSLIKTFLTYKFIPYD